MSKQDADDADTETASTDEESADGETNAEEEPLEEIAEKPEGDVDEILSEILTDDNQEGIAEVDAESTAVDDELVATIEQTPAEQLAQALTALQGETEHLEAELEEALERVDDLESRLKRKQADFQNYKKRQKKRMEEEKKRATEDLVKRLLDVRDNLQRALDQDEDVDIRGGVESTLEQFNQELDRENVEIIEPAVGSKVDPKRHEVLATIASDQPEDTVASLHRPGYEMAGKVIRPAQVAVSDGSAHEPDDSDEETEEQSQADDTDTTDAESDTDSETDSSE